jgi:hypothetical protein
MNMGYRIRRKSVFLGELKFAVADNVSIHGYGRYKNSGVQGTFSGACELYLTITAAGGLSRKLVWEISG